jgi:hypothetical protein
MFNFLKRRQKRKAAIQAAVQHFDPGASKQVARRMSAVIAEPDGGYVVRVCYGNTIPPHRAWFIVGPDSFIAPLTFDEVRQYGEREWR